jgi:hypothetical protein
MRQPDLRSVLRRNRCAAWALVRGVAVLLAIVPELLSGAEPPRQNPGGLISYPSFEVGPNLLTNSGFEESGAGAKPVGWLDNGFELDPDIFHTGTASLRLRDAYSIPYSQTAYQDVYVRKGAYRIGGMVKLRDVAATKSGGVRICLVAPPAYPATLGSGCTEILKGSQDWTYAGQSRIVIAQDTKARFSVAAYGDPDGSAWFDELELRLEQQVLDVYMLYPNYRGLLFDGQPAVSEFSVSVAPPPGMRLDDYTLRGQVIDEQTGHAVGRNEWPASPFTVVAFDMTASQPGRSYLAQFRLASNSGNAPEFTYPAYRLIRTPDRLASYKIAFDSKNRFLVNGKPTFLLGVYDSMGYSSTENGWRQLFETDRRLFELPINLYLNIWYGGVGNEAMNSMFNVLRDHGIFNLTNANCFGGASVEQMAQYWFIESSDTTVWERASHPGFGGFYAADECQGKSATNVFGHYQRMKALNPDGIVLGTQVAGYDLSLWRDSLDVLATDPYPLYGAAPSDGYPLYKVADAARQTREAVQNSRPFMMTLQFFQTTSNSRWPTRAELRSMSYAAIAEGANGLFFWTLGARGLAWVCAGWCDAKKEYFDRLKSVMTELRELEPVLTLPDAPDVLEANSNPMVRLRVKAGERGAFLIAYNASNKPQLAALRFRSPANPVRRNQSPGPAELDRSTLDVSLAPNEGRVYPLRLR